MDVSILYFGVRVNTGIERLGEKGPVGGCCLPSWPRVRGRPAAGDRRGAKGGVCVGIVIGSACRSTARQGLQPTACGLQPWVGISVVGRR